MKTSGYFTRKSPVFLRGVGIADLAYSLLYFLRFLDFQGSGMSSTLYMRTILLTASNSEAHAIFLISPDEIDKIKNKLRKRVGRGNR